MKSLSGILLLVGLFLFGCQSGENTLPNTHESGNEIKVVATTTMLTDLLEIIGGKDFEVVGLMGPGIDPHGYQATASDSIKIIDADIVAYNGIDLEGQMGQMFNQLGQMDKFVISLEDAVQKNELLASEDAGMTYDPHIWFDVELWAEAANHVTEKLSEYNPTRKEYYAENNEAYQIELEKLDAYIEARVREVDEEQRVLVTAHDAFSYLGEAYGFEVVGLQGLNTQSEAGTADISNLADFIAERKINALFVETSVPVRNIEALQAAVRSRGHQVSVGGELFSDSTGDASQNAETYLKMYYANIDTIVDALK